ncbi:MAG: hypothetical protein IK006_06955 [Bacteroidaceae bacterium]|nr:hypothetical protein [Bacteroidaceae bacterium]
MKRILFLSAISLVSLFSFSGCDKENPENENGNNETKGSKVETLSAEKGALCVATLTGRVSGLEGVALDFECGIEYSTDASFAEDKTTRQKADKKYSEDPYTVTITNVTSGQKYYYRAYYISQLMIYYGEIKDFTFTWDIPKMVDLGLSVKWASWNVGANNPWEYGDYYAWGETEPKTDYSWSTYKWCNGSYDTQNKYNTNSSYGTVDNKTTLDPEDDVAHVKWGGNWRMPTKAEQDDLRNKCTWTWYGSGNTEFNGIAGYKVTSNIEGYTDRFIFLPAAGCRYDTDLNDVGGYGDYWSSSLNANPGRAWDIYFNSSYVSTGRDYRYYGFSVRPVCP